jgi:hypothetical protein
MKIVDYNILSSDCDFKLESEVLESCEEGYQLYGELQIVPRHNAAPLYVQVVVKYAPEVTL